MARELTRLNQRQVNPSKAPPNDLVPPARTYLPRALEPSKIAPPSGEQACVGGVLDSGSNSWLEAGSISLILLHMAFILALSSSDPLFIMTQDIIFKCLRPEAGNR